MISTVSIRTRRAGFMARLLASCLGDLAAYRDGLVRDLRALVADGLAASLVAAVALSQLADAATTTLALADNWQESNPLSQAVIVRWGVAGLMVEKVVITTVVVVNMARIRGRTGRALGLLAALIGLGAVAWNLHVIG